MAKRRVTLKDIAREAGVSAATVSYVLNYSEKEKISHETRLKVFDIAKKLNYVPNMAAKSLASKRSYLVGIIINLGEKNLKSKLYEYYDLTNEIQKEVYKLGYDVVFLATKEPNKDIQVGQKRSLDAVFVIDMDKSKLKYLTSNFYVPVIFIDGYLEDPIFCKILSDYNELFNILEKKSEIKKDSYIIMEDYSNENLREIVNERFLKENIFVNKHDSDLIGFLEKHKNKRGVVLGEILGMQVEKYVDTKDIIVIIGSEESNLLFSHTKTISMSNKEKAKKSVELMQKLINLDEEEIINTTYIKPIFKY
ncbi:LacI family DNA-binding transcriptional regulator [Clostridium sp. D46t1_190503_E9]|uniref:LacI family DNA-binding transcriptional regulator n=1 Tax=Clostridium sp. D46t1_190503_E9 TaxID=2787137 RepID=UPI0018973429|nr:LacI family DNA-binding transcriptional regulator [Clostridium sp. D46t1_190503_E9]